jgi:hypothetical protein
VGANVTETLPVAINRGDIHAIDVPPSFEVADTFVVRIENHGSPTHVHLHLDDALSQVASLGASNRYVGDAEEVVVRVADGPRPAEGTLEVVTGYGAETARVAIDVVEPEQAEDAVAVDESMASPPVDGPDPEPTPSATPLPGISRDAVPVLALSGVAVVFAVVAAVISDALAVLLGVLAVLAGVAAAVVLLREE